MKRFIKKIPAQIRFPHEFRLEAVPPYQPAPAEQAYVDLINPVVDEVAVGAVADVAENFPDDLAAGRLDARTAAIAAINEEVDQFIGGHNPSCSTERIAKIRDRFATSLPKFGTRNAAEPKYDGAFDVVVVPDFVPGPDEQRFLAQIAAAQQELAADQDADATGRFSHGVIAARQHLRAEAVADLRRRVLTFWLRSSSATVAIEGLLLARGQYQALRDRLKRRLFNVEMRPDPTTGEKDKVLAITLLGGLAAPQDTPSAAKQDLFVQINKANTVLRTVCDRIRDRSERGLRSWLLVPDDKAKKHADQLESEFLGRLSQVARIGLELDFTDLAKRTLDEIRNDFFVREAGRIKNMYVRSLGAWAGAAAIVLIAFWAALNGKYLLWDWGFDHRSFLLAACGAAIGAWTSFSVRQVQFTFDDLVMVEESSLDPPMRILFVIVLTIAACLLFWTGAINLEIGDLQTEHEKFHRIGSIALLIGLFCGLSERALATAIAGRAANFARSVGGG